MTTRFVKWCSFQHLPCANAAVQDVVLCLQTSELIVQPDPPCGLAITTIEATICQAFSVCDACQRILWNYTFSYDDTQLTNPTTPLVAGDITGVFCRDCLTEYINEQISCAGGSSVCVQSSDTIDFSITEDGCITGDVIGGGGANDWHITGNSDIVDGINFLGTTNDVAVDLRTKNERAFRLQPANPLQGNIPDIIGGLSENAINAGSSGSGNAILSGGYPGDPNLIGIGANVIFNSVIGGGWKNHIFSDASSDSGIFCGHTNLINGSYAAGIFSGQFHSITASAGDFIGGGIANTIENVVSTAPTTCNGIVAGDTNTITDGVNSFIGGGYSSELSGVSYATLCGGKENSVTITTPSTTNISLSSSLLGGEGHIVTDGMWETLGGGYFNSILEITQAVDPDFVGLAGFNVLVGGDENIVDSTFGGSMDVDSTWQVTHNSILGGQFNSIGTTFFNPASFYSSVWNVIGGGFRNSMINQEGSVISGGEDNACTTTASFPLRDVPSTITDTFYDRTNTIGGGYRNKIVDSILSFIGGGGADWHGSLVTSNLVQNSSCSAVVSGNGNQIIDTIPSTLHWNYYCNAILSGEANLISNGQNSSILGGAGLKIGASTAGIQNAGVLARVLGQINPVTQADISGFSNVFYLGDFDLWLGNVGGNPMKLKFFEANASATYTGTNYSSFEAQNQSANIEYIWPAAQPTAGQSLKCLSVSGNRITLQWA